MQTEFLVILRQSVHDHPVLAGVATAEEFNGPVSQMIGLRLRTNLDMRAGRMDFPPGTTREAVEKMISDLTGDQRAALFRQMER